MKNKSLSTKLLIGTVLTGIALSSVSGVSHAETIKVMETTKYPNHVIEILRLSLGIDKDSTELDYQIESMPKIQVMDKYLASYGNSINGNEVREAVLAIFNIDLDTISENNYGSKLNSYDSVIMETLRDFLSLTVEEIMKLSKVEVMDSYIKANDYSLNSAENRQLINQIFGVNLDGISGLEHAQLGIYSKGAWVIHNDNDMFVVSSSLDDVTVNVETTDFYKDLLGLEDIPEHLKTTLINSGFIYDEVSKKYSYTNPTGESVPDAFKTQIIGAIVQTIQEINANLK